MANGREVGSNHNTVSKVLMALLALRIGTLCLPIRTKAILLMKLNKPLQLQLTSKNKEVSIS
jgi:hypothetical protein